MKHKIKFQNVMTYDALLMVFLGLNNLTFHEGATKKLLSGFLEVFSEELDEQINSMINITENLVTIGNQTRRVCTCNVCGKEGIRANIKTHIEANHIISNVSHSCDICGKISRSRNGLRLHKSKEHCTKNFTGQETV